MYDNNGRYLGNGGGQNFAPLLKGALTIGAAAWSLLRKGEFSSQTFGPDQTPQMISAGFTELLFNDKIAAGVAGIDGLLDLIG